MIVLLLEPVVLMVVVVKWCLVTSLSTPRDLAGKKAEWDEVIRARILMPTFVGSEDLMWPHDPLGRAGPSLDTFLAF